MKNEMMEDYSVTCALGRYGVQALFFSPLSYQSTELQGAAPRPLRCVCGFPPCSKASFLSTGYAIREVSMSPFLQVLTSPFEKKPHTFQPGKASVHFLLDLAERRGFSDAAQSKSLTAELWIAPWKRFCINYRGIPRWLTWDAGKSTQCLHTIAMYNYFFMDNYFFNKFLKTFIQVLVTFVPEIWNVNLQVDNNFKSSTIKLTLQKRSQDND